MRLVQAILLIAFYLVGVDSKVFAEEITGKARVLYGDTIKIGRRKIRFYGIDAIDVNQPCENAYGQPFDCDIIARDAVRASSAGGG